MFKAWLFSKQFEAADKRIAELEAENKRLLDRILEMSGQRALYRAEELSVEELRRLYPVQGAEQEKKVAPTLTEAPAPVLTMDQVKKPKPEAPERRSLDALTVIDRAMAHRNKVRGTGN